MAIPAGGLAVVDATGFLHGAGFEPEESLRRRATDAVCVALHPRMVDTALSASFAKQGLTVQAPDDAAARLLALLDRLEARDSSGFFAPDGSALPW